jgi:protoporphyrinogen oxidase
LDLIIQTWDQAIPIYNLERTQSIKGIHKNFKQILPGLVITGNYIDGVSLRHIISNAKDLVDSI